MNSIVTADTPKTTMYDVLLGKMPAHTARHRGVSYTFTHVKANVSVRSPTHGWTYHKIVLQNNKLYSVIAFVVGVNPHNEFPQVEDVEDGARFTDAEVAMISAETGLTVGSQFIEL